MAEYLTKKQESFCLEFIRNGGDASAAYRSAGYSTDMKPESIWQSASRLLNSVKVSSRLAEIKAEAAERSAVTIDSLNTELHEVKQAAMESGQYGPAVSAIMGKAKVNGLLEKKVIVKTEPQQPNIRGFRMVSEFSPDAVSLPSNNGSGVEVRAVLDPGESLSDYH